MFKLLKNNSTHFLQIKLIYVYILNVLDILFTLSLLKTGLFKEANLLMINIVDHPLISIVVKLIFPALLIIYTLVNLPTVPGYQLRFCNFFINLIFIIYLALTLLHLGYTIFFFYTLLVAL